MHVVTNRKYNPRAKTADELFGDRPNDPIDELRLAKVTGKPGGFQFEIFEEQPGMGKPGKPWPSETLFLQLKETMKAKKKKCVFFVHGYKNSFGDALNTAYDIQQRYKLEVILFSWPSDGKLQRYKNDKRDAAASHLALDRALEKLTMYMHKHIKGDEDLCGQGFTLMTHSMGNYLLKFLLKSSAYQGETMIFDNIVLAAADVNHHDHIDWVNRLKVRNRVYITINEDDFALMASRAKFGEAQQARLGHTVRGHKSSQAVYLDFSQAKGIGDSHSYFSDAGPQSNLKIRGVFKTILGGGRVEHALDFDPDTHTYRVT